MLKKHAGAHTSISHHTNIIHTDIHIYSNALLEDNNSIANNIVKILLTKLKSFFNSTLFMCISLQIQTK